MCSGTAGYKTARQIYDLIYRLWLLRTKANLSAAQVEVLAGRLFDYLHRRIVQFVMRQKNDDPTDITLVCVQSLRMERALRHLDNEGWYLYSLLLVYMKDIKER